MATIVRVTFDPDGNATSEVIGMKGKGCDNIQKVLDCLGKTISDEKKPEYYQAESEGLVYNRG